MILIDVSSHSSTCAYHQIFTRSFISLFHSRACISHRIVLSSVVFPAPFFPMIPILSCLCTCINSGSVTSGYSYPTSIFLSLMMTSGSLILDCTVIYFHSVSFSGFSSLSILSRALIRLWTLDAFAELARNLLIYASCVSISFC